MNLNLIFKCKRTAKDSRIHERTSFYSSQLLLRLNDENASLKSLIIDSNNAELTSALAFMETKFEKRIQADAEQFDRFIEKSR